MAQVLTNPGAKKLLSLKTAYLSTLKIGLFQNPFVPSAPANSTSWARPSGGGYADLLLGSFGAPVSVPGPFFQVMPPLAIFAPSSVVTPGQTITGYFLFDPAIITFINDVVLYEFITTTPLPLWAPAGVPVTVQYLMQESQFNPSGFTP